MKGKKNRGFVVVTFWGGIVVGLAGAFMLSDAIMALGLLMMIVGMVKAIQIGKKSRKSTQDELEKW